MNHLEQSIGVTVAPHTLRIRYQASEDCMLIDMSTLQSLEILQNMHNVKSNDCLFGSLNETLTPMGSRLLRSSILQPSTLPDVLIARYDAVEELSSNEDMFFAVRKGMPQLARPGPYQHG